MLDCELVTRLLDGLTFTEIVSVLEDDPQFDEDSFKYYLAKYLGENPRQAQMLNDEYSLEVL